MRKLKLLKITYYFILLFFLMEFFLRIYKIESLNYFINLKKIHTYHPDYLVGLKPETKEFISHFTGKWSGWFTINSYGFRNLEEPVPKKNKILCLGDSLVMGFGVSDEETFCHLLNQEYYKNYQFLNTGVDGLGTYGYYQRLKETLEKVDHIKTVLLFISPNDYAMPEILRNQGFKPDDEIDKIRLENPSKRFFDAMQFIITDRFYSYFILKILIKQLLIKWEIFKQEIKNDVLYYKNKKISEWIYESFIMTTQKQRKCISNEEKEKIYSTIGKEFHFHQRVTTSKPFICPEPIPEKIKNQCTDSIKVSDLHEFTEIYFKKIIELSQQKKFQLVIVIIPVQMEEIYCHQIQKYHPLREYALKAKDFFNKHQIPVIDLIYDTAKMCSIGEYGIQDFFIPEDGHLTKLGNLWVYQILTKKLEPYLD